jgi:hypothetical protein
LNPWQTSITPAALGTAAARIVEFALETFEDIEDLLELSPRGGFRGGDGAGTAAAEEQQHVAFLRLAFEFAQEARIARKRRARGPRHRHAVGDIAHELALFRRANIDEARQTRVDELERLIRRDVASVCQSLRARCGA